MLKTRVFNSISSVSDDLVVISDLSDDMVPQDPIIDDVDTSITSFLRVYGRPPVVEFEDDDVDESGFLDDDESVMEPVKEPAAPTAKPAPQPAVEEGGDDELRDESV